MEYGVGTQPIKTRKLENSKLFPGSQFALGNVLRLLTELKFLIDIKNLLADVVFQP